MRPPQRGARPFRAAALWSGAKVRLCTRTGCPEPVLPSSTSRGLARVRKDYHPLVRLVRHTRPVVEGTFEGGAFLRFAALVSKIPCVHGPNAVDPRGTLRPGPGT